MKNILLIVGLSFLLVGCELFTKIETRTETVYRPIFPPEYLTAPCYAERPERASLRDIIEIQDRTIQRCNNQILSIQQWVELERTQLQEREKANEDQ